MAQLFEHINRMIGLTGLRVDAGQPNLDLGANDGVCCQWKQLSGALAVARSFVFSPERGVDLGPSHERLSALGLGLDVGGGSFPGSEEFCFCPFLVSQTASHDRFLKLSW